MTTTTSLIGAALASPSFGTTATAKATWTPAANTWTSGPSSTTNIAYVSKVAIYLWGSAADKTAEDPYKTMNTWYTTNKAAIDTASLAASTQVASWALYMDLTLNVKSTELLAPPQLKLAIPTAGNTASLNTSTSTGFHADSTIFPAIGTWGDNFTMAITNKTTTAKTPALRWGTRVTTLGTVSVAGTAVNGLWYSFAWGSAPTIASYATMTAAEHTTLSGKDLTDYTTAVVFTDTALGTLFPVTTPATGELTCDTTKWASATACDGVTRWGLGATTE